MRTAKLDIRGLSYHIQEWGDASNPTLIMLHGWMDCGGSYQFVAEHLAEKYHLVAPDLRGFGETEHAQGYWFPDYFADVDEVLDYYVPNGKANLVGHSMGGNIALMYAGIRPERVGNVLSLDALGMSQTQSGDALERYRRWMREILSGEPSKVYPDEAALRHSIAKGNPSLNDEIVSELVVLWGKPFGEDGAMQLKHDHAHRYANPVRYDFDEVVAVWQAVTAKVGMVLAKDSSVYARFVNQGRVEQAKKILKIKDEHHYMIENSGHMLHLEQPQATAEAIDLFFSE